MIIIKGLTYNSIFAVKGYAPDIETEQTGESEGFTRQEKPTVSEPLMMQSGLGRVQSLDLQSFT